MCDVFAHFKIKCNPVSFIVLTHAHPLPLAHRCVMVAWTSPTTFVSAHANGAMFLYNTTIADAAHRTSVGSFEPTDRHSAAGGAAAAKGQKNTKKAGNPVRTWGHVTASVTTVAMSSAKTHSASGDSEGRLWVRDVLSKLARAECADADSIFDCFFAACSHNRSE